MTQSAQTPTAPPGNWNFRVPQFALGSAIICLLIVAVYYQVLVKLVTDWWNIPDFSHGFLVPLFAAYLVWEKRETLRGTTIAPLLEWNCRDCPGAGRSASGGLRFRALPLAGFAESFCWPDWCFALADGSS
jgi:hypothetical protein